MAQLGPQLAFLKARHTGDVGSNEHCKCHLNSKSNISGLINEVAQLGPQLAFLRKVTAGVTDQVAQLGPQLAFLKAQHAGEESRKLRV